VENKIIKLAFIILIMSGCSSKTQVHLFGANLDQTAIKQIEARIDKQRFELKVNKQPFPDSINSNAVIFTPGKNANQRVLDIIDVVTELGYKVPSTNLIMQNNHSFSANNMGLYLLPDGFVIKETIHKIPLANEYGSRNCFNTTNLVLKEDQNFLLTVNRWDSDKEDYIENFYRGKWYKDQADVIELIHTSWQDNLFFLRSEDEVNSNDGRRRVVSLLPQSSPKTEQLRVINCTYSISLII